MSEAQIGVVITVGEGREENLKAVLAHLFEMNSSPVAVVIILDGARPVIPEPPPTFIPILVQRITKHEPGQEQPRNVGVRLLREDVPACTHAWFLDSDVLPEPTALDAYHRAIEQVGGEAILVGPYEWMPEGVREPHPEIRSDFRWPMFEERGLGPWVGELGVALGCFGGNLVWPIEPFVRLGGFHAMLHHGRCEDGELGLRAASHRIPMALVAEARGYHMAHPINTALAEQRNMRDVPLLNSWHPWVEQQGLIVTDQDGARFDYKCTCGQQVNTLQMWQHMSEHHGALRQHIKAEERRDVVDRLQNSGLVGIRQMPPGVQRYYEGDAPEDVRRREALLEKGAKLRSELDDELILPDDLR